MKEEYPEIRVAVLVVEEAANLALLLLLLLLRLAFVRSVGVSVARSDGRSVDRFSLTARASIMKRSLPACRSVA